MAFFLMVATGCQSTGKHVRWYEGPAATSDQVALLKIQRRISLFASGPILTVDKIDGRPLVTEHLMGNNAEEIELLPGPHELLVSYFDGDNRSTADAKISFLAEPGTIYELHGAQKERSFGKELIQSLTFQHWSWTCWIVEEKTKKVVAGTPRGTPFHWYE